MFTGAAFFLPFLPQGVFDQTMALSLHLFVVSTQVPGVPEALPYGVALVLIAMVLLMNSLSIAIRIYLQGEEEVVERLKPRTCRRSSEPGHDAAAPDGAAAVEAGGVGPDHPLRQPSRPLRCHPGGPRARDPRHHRPRQCGKTSFLKALNRMDLFNAAMRVEGDHPLRRPRRAPVAQRLRPAQADRRRVSPARGPAAHRLRQRGPRAAAVGREEVPRTST